jgi:hypothetical protein
MQFEKSKSSSTNPTGYVTDLDKQSVMITFLAVGALENFYFLLAQRTKSLQNTFLDTIYLL